MKYSICMAAAVSCLGGLASAATVNGFSGPWTDVVTTAGGSAEIVDLTGVGGNLEANAPDGDGAVRLTTDGDVNTRAEIGVSGNFGTVADILNGGLSFSYSWFDTEGTADAAPSFKLAFYNASHPTDTYGQLIFEPYWQSADGSSTVAVTKGDWVTTTIDLTTGRFWTSGMFGAASSGGGPPNRTLSEWASLFGPDPDGFAGASLIGISIGLGSYNTNETGYVDAVSWTGTAADASYNFAVSEVPLPAGLSLMLGALGALGFAGRRRR